jgi:hypothetical protein
VAGEFLPDRGGDLAGGAVLAGRRHKDLYHILPSRSFGLQVEEAAAQAGTGS